MSNRGIAAMILTALFATGAAVAATAHSPQQERMKQCNVEAKAKSLAGEPRREFMKSCLSTHHEHESKAALSRPRERMKACNTDARSKGLKGAERRNFMSACLRSS